MILISGDGCKSEEYRKHQDELKIKALADPDKQTAKECTCIIKKMQISVGLCPNCGHCLTSLDTKCDECFQTIKWQ